MTCYQMYIPRTYWEVLMLCGCQVDSLVRRPSGAACRYFPGPHGFDSLIVGYYDGDKLMYVARTRNGFVPASRRRVFSRLKHLVTLACPFVNLPETRQSRFGEELNAEKMKKAVWLRPEAVAQIEFLEWTVGDRLRHSKFVGLREDKNARSVVKEHASEASNITLGRELQNDTA